MRQAICHLRQNFVAYLALFFALSGTAMAARPLFTGADIEDDSLTGADVNEPTLAGIPMAALGFDPATQGELDGHKTSGDHDGRYATPGDLAAHRASGDHDGRYFTQAQLQTSAPGSNRVHWNNLVGVPVGFADGEDAPSVGYSFGTATAVGVETVVASIDVPAGNYLVMGTVNVRLNDVIDDGGTYHVAQITCLFVANESEGQVFSGAATASTPSAYSINAGRSAELPLTVLGNARVWAAGGTAIELRCRKGSNSSRATVTISPMVQAVEVGRLEFVP